MTGSGPLVAANDDQGPKSRGEMTADKHLGTDLWAFRLHVPARRLYPAEPASRPTLRLFDATPTGLGLVREALARISPIILGHFTVADSVSGKDQCRTTICILGRVSAYDMTRVNQLRVLAATAREEGMWPQDNE